MSIYSDLKDADLLPALTEDEMYPGAGLSTPMLVDTPDGEPLLGLGYHANPDAHEEEGTTLLPQAISSAAHPDSLAGRLHDGERAAFHQSDLVCERDALVAFVHPSMRNSERLDAILDRAERHISTYQVYAQGIDPWVFERQNLPELKQEAKRRGIRFSHLRRDALIAALIQSETPQRPNTHSAWFADGRVLVLRRDGGAFEMILDRLLDAARAGTLTTGRLGSNVFVSGLSLFDVRDFGPKTEAELTTSHEEYRQRMTALAPVAEELTRRGFSWYALGNPRVLDTGDGRMVARYWLNGSPLSSGSTFPSGLQPYGWYTLEELLAEKFVHDAHERQSTRSG